MLAQLSTSNLVNCPQARSTDRPCCPPNINIMMSDPTTAMIQILSCFTTINSNFLDHIHQGQMTFRQVCRFNRPIINLSITINGPIGTPSRLYVFIPDPFVNWMVEKPGREDAINR